MQVFYHLVYEYQKGLRDLSLFTCPDMFQEKIEKSLRQQEIEYIVCPLDGGKINVFFGRKECLEIVRRFSCEKLNKLAPEEDFILGMMLGYAKHQQYDRFLKQKEELCLR